MEFREDYCAFFLFVIFSIFSLSLMSLAFSAHHSFTYFTTTGTTPPPGFIEIYKRYYKIQWPREVDGKLAYMAWYPLKEQRSGHYYFIDLEGEIITPEMLGGSNAAPLENYLLSYTQFKTIDARLERSGDDTYIVYNGKEIGREYYEVSYPFEFKGKLGFVATMDTVMAGYDYNEFIVLEQ